MFGRIYKITNSFNNTFYIGSTTSTLAERFSKHKCQYTTRTSKFYTAMQELGKENFSICLIKEQYYDNRKSLEQDEFNIMKDFIASGHKLYNDFIGCVSDEMKAKISRKLVGRCQEQSRAFKYGSVYIERNDYKNCIRFTWRENGKAKSKNFSISKFGIFKAYELVYEQRKSIYPTWRTPEECITLEFLNIEY